MGSPKPIFTRKTYRRLSAVAYAQGRTLGRLAARLLTSHGITMAPGLTDHEIDRAEREFGFSFADDHRALLAAGLPVGDKWPDWRDPDDELADQLRWPIDGVLYDVARNDYWYPEWGVRPDEVEDAVTTADSWLAMAPRMVPVYGHRYLPAGVGSYGHPVLSMWQTDVIVYGADLADYVEHEQAGRPVGDAAVSVEFWRDLVG
jgi:hypothetical protein